MKNSTVFIGREIQEETRKWLFEKQLIFEEHPLFEIELNKPDVLFFKQIVAEKKIFLVTSQWAAKWLVLNATEIGFIQTDFILCLSKKQKEICSIISENILVAEEKNADSLAKLVLDKIQDENLIYLKGNNSLTVLQSILKINGIRIAEIEVYKNLPSQKTIENEFDIYLFFSPSGISNFYESGNRIPVISKIVAIGKTTAVACRNTFSNEVFISPVQEELATVKYAINISRTEHYQMLKI